MSRTIALALLLALAACNRQPGAEDQAPPPDAPAAEAAAPAPAEEQLAESEAEEESEAEPIAERRPSPQAAAEEPEEETAEGCEGEIGLQAAQRLARQCRDVSPATRPPCNVANSCGMIRDEIRRGCDMLAEDAPAFCSRGG
jgi:hypothetical protein